MDTTTNVPNYRTLQIADGCHNCIHRRPCRAELLKLYCHVSGKKVDFNGVCDIHEEGTPSQLFGPTHRRRIGIVGAVADAPHPEDAYSG
jgi:hypothetical protein